jgi:hypothetical protein
MAGSMVGSPPMNWTLATPSAAAWSMTFRQSSGGMVPVPLSGPELL